MKKAIFAICIVMLIAGSANAVTLLAGDFQAHFTDGSALYVPQDEGPAIPRAPLDIDAPGGGAPAGWEDTSATGGEENRAIFSVNQFLQDESPYYAVPPGELTGLFYDLSLATFTGDPVGGSATLYFTGTGRNPVTDPEGGALAAPAGYGGVLEVWYDPTPDPVGDALFDPNSDGLGPQAWVENGGPADANHLIGGTTDGYPTVNIADDSVLWLQAVFVPQLWLDLDGDGFAETPILMREIIDLPTFSGSSILAFLNITGGTAAGMFERNVFGPGNDLSMASTFLLPGSLFDNGYWDTPQDHGNWPILSSDPVRGEIIPEPATLTLLGLGLAGLGLRIRRKKRT